MVILRPITWELIWQQVRWYDVRVRMDDQEQGSSQEGSNTVKGGTRILDGTLRNGDERHGCLQFQIGKSHSEDAGADEFWSFYFQGSKAACIRQVDESREQSPESLENIGVRESYRALQEWLKSFRIGGALMCRSLWSLCLPV